MNAQANRLSSVADNIANSSTVGYKKSSTQFSSMLLPGSDGSYNSGGVNTTVRYSIENQGSFTNTTSSTDLAINGDGFFIVRGADGEEYMTRAGNFEKMDDGTLQNAAGYTLMGYPYSSTEDPTIVINGFEGLSPIDIGAGGLSSTPSEAGKIEGNLNGNSAVGTSYKASLVAYDSQGNSRKLNLEYVKTATNAWDLTVSYTDGSGTTTTLATESLTFGADGQLTSAGSITTTGLTIEGATLNPLDIDISATTQKGNDSAVEGDIDGQGASGVDRVEISTDGIVSIVYENGQSVPKFRIALATVQSPNNLTPLAGNVFSQSNDSGVVVMGYAGSSGYGSIRSNTLEDSNVDIAEELTSMIESQRNYTANSKVFQTGSELLETLVNLKR
jgi:flagellar hook protein FlgE